MLDSPAAKDHQAGYFRTDVDESAPVFFIVIGKSAFRRRQRFEHHPLDFKTRPSNCLFQILAAGARSRNDVYKALEPRTAHADRFGYPVLSIDYEFLR